MDEITNGSDKDWISGSVFWLRGTENRIKIKRLSNEWKKRTNGSEITNGSDND